MMKDKRKRYPWNKLFFRRKPQDPAAIESVYAGPPYRKQTEPIMEEVYAGPEYYERSADEPDVDEPEKLDEPINLVYAGPAFIETKRPQLLATLPDDEEQPEPPAEPEELPPPPSVPAPDPQMFMCVYAGPEYWDAPPQPDEAPDCVICPHCGTPLSATDRFCTECGWQMKKEE